MADRTVTASSVVKSSAATTQQGTALSAITAGQVIYKDPTTSNWAPASSGASTLQTNFAVALNSAAANQPVSFTQADTAFTPGLTTLTGEVLFLSTNPGALCPYADLTTGEQPVSIYLGTGTSTAVLNISAAGVKK